MRTRPIGAIVATLVVLALAPTPAAGQALPRTADGKPDLSGIWQAVNTAAWNILPHPAEAGVPAGLGVVEGNDDSVHTGGGGKTAGELREPRDARSRNEVLAARRPTRDLHGLSVSDCSDAELRRPSSTSTRTPSRNIFMNSQHPRGPIEWWMGDSRGRWEGDTLVVDVVHFNDQTWFDRAGNHHSEQLHVIERYTLMSANHINYEATIEDPKVFTRPWKMSMPLYRRLDPNMQTPGVRVLRVSALNERAWIATVVTALAPRKGWCAPRVGCSRVLTRNDSPPCRSGWCSAQARCPTAGTVWY